MEQLDIAAIQFCAGAALENNLAYLSDQLALAVEHPTRPQVIVLPENFACYGGDYRRVAETGAVPDWLQQQARRHRVWLVGGSVPLITRPHSTETVAWPRVRPACLVYSPQGVLVARYDKLHLFDADVEDNQGRYRESDTFEAGQEVVTAAIAGTTAGLAICYDVRFPALMRALADAGASWMLLPSAFTAKTGEAHWHVLLRARAIETGSYVLGVNQCGQHSPQRASYGHTMLVDPWGQVVATLDGAPGILHATLAMSQVQQVRQRMPVHQHQRFQCRLTPHD